MFWNRRGIRQCPPETGFAGPPGAPPPVQRARGMAPKATQGAPSFLDTRSITYSNVA